MIRHVNRLCKKITIVCRQQIERSTHSSVVVEKDENITLIGINREKDRNALDSVTLRELDRAINDFENDSLSAVAVLYGVGGSFCSGYDVSEMEYSHFWQQNPITKRNIGKPIVAGISGFCTASGFELALACDLRVMEDTAMLGFFNRYMGMPMCDAGNIRLTKAVGFARALDIIMTGRRVTAREAFEIGLINRIVATGTALGQSVTLALSIAKFSQNAVIHDRTALLKSAYDAKTFNEIVDEEIMLTSKDVLEEMKIGVRKFKDSTSKGAKVDSFNIKDKEIPDWEKLEIAREKDYGKKILLEYGKCNS